MTIPCDILSSIESSVLRYPNAAAYKIPNVDDHTGHVREWISISYTQFWLDVQTCARRWLKILRSAGLPLRSVIGLWLVGSQYSDAVLIYGILRAGYIPQLISLNLSSPDIIYDLLKGAGAKALIFSPCLELGLPEKADVDPLLHFPTFLSSEEATDYDREVLPDVHEENVSHGPVMILHTSGSTSGIPKLVPWSYNWTKSLLRKISIMFRDHGNSKRQIVSVWTGGVCHSAQNVTNMRSFMFGSCMVQPTTLDYSTTELMDMVDRCGVTRLAQFPGLLSKHLREARKDAKILETYSNMDEALFAGFALPIEDQEWAMKNGITLSCVFASTECGMLLRNLGGHMFPDALLYNPIDVGCSHIFMPLAENDTKPQDLSSSDQQSDADLLELIILSSSDDCPDVSLRSKDDGHFHTGDLFEEVKPGLYAYRGRNDDWIKLSNAGRCDTRSIEDNVRETCSDLVKQCVVVGSFRPCISLVIEHPPVTEEVLQVIKLEIIRRIQPFHAKLHRHERLTDPRMIVAVPLGSLPRTAAKGNIRRKAVEEQFKGILDDVYSKIEAS